MRALPSFVLKKCCYCLHFKNVVVIIVMVIITSFLLLQWCFCSHFRTEPFL